MEKVIIQWDKYESEKEKASFKFKVGKRQYKGLKLGNNNFIT